MCFENCKQCKNHHPLDEHLLCNITFHVSFHSVLIIQAQSWSLFLHFTKGKKEVSNVTMLMITLLLQTLRLISIGLQQWFSTAVVH